MYKLLLLFFAFSFAVVCPSYSQTGKKKHQTKKTTAIKSPARSAQSVRGAATAEELGNLVFESLKANDAGMLDGYFPAQTDLETISKSKDEDVGLVMEETSPDQVRAAFVEDFQNLMKDAVTNNVSFAEMSLSEVIPPKAPSANRLHPVKLLVSDGAHTPFTVVFEAMKINGRYFLFQNIGLADS